MDRLLVGIVGQRVAIALARVDDFPSFGTCQDDRHQPEFLFRLILKFTQIAGLQAQSTCEHEKLRTHRTYRLFDGIRCDSGPLPSRIHHDILLVFCGPKHQEAVENKQRQQHRDNQAD
jgi:hypothetical protein